MASKRRLRRRTCARKRRFATPEEAWQVVGWMKWTRQPNCDQVDVYECRFCGGFHIGRMRIKDIKKMRGY